MHLEYGIGNDDDIDHLGNRRIREMCIRDRLTTAEFIEAIKELSVLELNDLVKACEEEFGLSLIHIWWRQCFIRSM